MTEQVVEYVNEKIKRELESWSSKIGKKYEEIYNDYISFAIPESIKENSNRTIAEHRERALRILRNKYTRLYGAIKRSKAQMYTGFIEGNKLENRTETMLRIIEAAMKDEGKRRVLIERGLLTENEVPIDTRAVIDGRRNPNYQKPLANSPPQWILNMYGFALVDNKWREFIMTGWGEQATKLSFKAYTPVEFRAIPKAVVPKLQLGATSLTSFNDISERASWDIEKIIRENGKFNKLSEIDSLLKLRGSDRVHRFQVSITRVVPEVSEDRENYLAYITDDSLDFDEVTMFVPSSIPVEFGDDTDAFVLGRIGKSRDRNVVTAIGILPLSGRSTFKGTTRFTAKDLTDMVI